MQDHKSGIEYPWKIAKKTKLTLGMEENKLLKNFELALCFSKDPWNITIDLLEKTIMESNNDFYECKLKSTYLKKSNQKFFTINKSKIHQLITEVNKVDVTALLRSGKQDKDNDKGQSDAVAIINNHIIKNILVPLECWQSLNSFSSDTAVYEISAGEEDQEEFSDGEMDVEEENQGEEKQVKEEEKNKKRKSSKEYGSEDEKQKNESDESIFEELRENSEVIAKEPAAVEGEEEGSTQEPKTKRPKTGPGMFDPLNTGSTTTTTSSVEQNIISEENPPLTLGPGGTRK